MNLNDQEQRKAFAERVVRLIDAFENSPLRERQVLALEDIAESCTSWAAAARMEMEVEAPGRVVAYCDGGCKPTNPGNMYYSYMITEQFKDEIKVVGTVTNPSGYGTNNIAEYDAMRMVLDCLRRKYTDTLIEVRTDSQLVIKQISGEFKCKDEKLKPLLKQVKDIIHGIKSHNNDISFHYENEKKIKEILGH